VEHGDHQTAGFRAERPVLSCLGGLIQTAVGSFGGRGILPLRCFGFAKKAPVHGLGRHEADTGVAVGAVVLIDLAGAILTGISRSQPPRNLPAIDEATRVSAPGDLTTPPGIQPTHLSRTT